MSVTPPQPKADAPFYCGSQYGDWLESNCYRCRRLQHRRWDQDYWNDPVEPRCEIEEALSRCAITGEVPYYILRAIHFQENREHYVWPCPEWRPDTDTVKRARDPSALTQGGAFTEASK